MPASRGTVLFKDQSARKEIQRCQTIRKASCQVYEALRKACTKHKEYVAHFRMEAENVIIDQDSSLQVKFDMAFTRRVPFDTLCSVDPVWILVDSITNEHLENCDGSPSECFDRLENSLKRQLGPVNTPTAKKVKKSVKFTSSVAVPAPMPSIDYHLPVSIRALRIWTGQDLCDHLRRYFRQPLQKGTCVVLEDSPKCKQRVYPSPFASSSQSRKPTSLRQIITSTGKPEIRGGILVHERISIAKLLANAVLQYHATPWLRLSWSSDDVLFFGTKADKQTLDDLNLSAPYINARIQDQPTQVPAQSPAMARNPVLFSLGVALLEIAHAASLESLRLPCDADNGLLHSEFFTARRLAKVKRTDLGITYSNIVEQLVEGAFPCGDDLSNPELQTTFYKDVIRPLDDLEQGFRNLCMCGR